MTQAKILCWSGSLRKESFNKKLVKIAMSAAEKAGAEVTYIDLKELPLPIYDEDSEKESGIPDNAKKIKKLIKEHNAFLIASPEYNSGMSAALKNMIDWASRPEPGEKMLECFLGKTAGIMAASPGALGGLRGLVGLRSVLGNINVLVVPDQVAVSKANEAFDDAGKLKDEKMQAQVEKIGKRVCEIAGKIS